jgi:hypothetical protein
MRERNLSGNFALTDLFLNFARHQIPRLKPIPNSKNQNKTVMKTTLYSILAAAACGMALGQTAYTTPVGYTTQTLKPSVFNSVGFNLLKPSLAAGALTAVSVDGLTLTNSAATFIAALPAGKMCTVEITSGTAIGSVREFNSWTNTTISISSAITGLLEGDKFIVRVDPTLQELFPSGAPLTGGALNPTNADIVWVPNGVGAYDKYFYKTNVTGGAIGWWTTVTGTTLGTQVLSDVPLLYTDGILIQRKAGVDKDLVISGEVKTVGSNPYILNGYNAVSINPPVGLTLFTAGFYPVNFTGGALNPTNADILWVPNGLGGYVRYWYKTNATGGAIGWWTTNNGTTLGTQVLSDISLPSSVKIQRKGAAKFMNIAVPNGYSNL